jgi:hypothetical protein
MDDLFSPRGLSGRMLARSSDCRATSHRGRMMRDSSKSLI